MVDDLLELGREAVRLGWAWRVGHFAIEADDGWPKLVSYVVQAPGALPPELAKKSLAHALVETEIARHIGAPCVLDLSYPEGARLHSDSIEMMTRLRLLRDPVPAFAATGMRGHLLDWIRERFGESRLLPFRVDKNYWRLGYQPDPRNPGRVNWMTPEIFAYDEVGAMISALRHRCTRMN